MNKDVAVINKRTKIELGLIIAVLSVCGGLITFAYRGFAMVEKHEEAIGALQNKVDKIDKIAEDVSYIKGRIDSFGNRSK